MVKMGLFCQQLKGDVRLTWGTDFVILTSARGTSELYGRNRTLKLLINKGGKDGGGGGNRTRHNLNRPADSKAFNGSFHSLQPRY